MFIFTILRRRWILLTVALPAALWAMDRIGAAIEARRGTPSSITRALRRPRSERRARRKGVEPVVAV
ncbi:MAG: hypothetical protein ABIP21_09280 [Acidimicrobiia bacterium]